MQSRAPDVGVRRNLVDQAYSVCPHDVRYRVDDAYRERWHTMESELSGDQHQLLRAFDELAGGSPTTDVTASATAQEAGFDSDSREFEAALDYLVDVGCLVRTGDEGEEAFKITVEGINEVQRRPQL